MLLWQFNRRRKLKSWLQGGALLDLVRPCRCEVAFCFAALLPVFSRPVCHLSSLPTALARGRLVTEKLWMLQHA